MSRHSINHVGSTPTPSPLHSPRHIDDDDRVLITHVPVESLPVPEHEIRAEDITQPLLNGIAVTDRNAPTPAPPNNNILISSSRSASPLSMVSTYWTRRMRKFQYFKQRMSRSKLCLLFLHSLILLTVWVANNVIWVFVSVRFGQSYAFFLCQITTIWLIIMQLPVLAYRLYHGQITREMRKSVSYRTLMQMGLIDAWYFILTTLGSVYTPPTFQTLIFQLPIPLCMLFSYIGLRARYSWGQYIGATIILASSVGAVLPSLISPDVGDSTKQGQKTMSIVWYTVGAVLFSLNCVYKEWALKGTNVDVFHLSAVENSFNVMFAFASIPLLWLPGMGNDTPSNTFQHFWGGNICYFLGDSTIDPTAECSTLLWLTTFYSLFSMLTQVWILIVCRLGSSVVMNIISALQVPISNIFFAVPSIMGQRLVQHFSIYTILSLIGVSFGFGIYSAFPSQPRDETTSPQPPIETELSKPKRDPIVLSAHIIGLLPAVNPDEPNHSIQEDEDRRDATRMRYAYMDRLGITNRAYTAHVTPDYGSSLSRELPHDMHEPLLLSGSMPSVSYLSPVSSSSSSSSSRPSWRQSSRPSSPHAMGSPPHVL